MNGRLPDAALDAVGVLAGVFELDVVLALGVVLAVDVVLVGAEVLLVLNELRPETLTEAPRTSSGFELLVDTLPSTGIEPDCVVAA